MIGRLLAIMFLSRDLAHRMHLKTDSYAQHVALGSFYDSIVDLADSIADMYQGRNGIIKEIPLLEDDEDLSDPVEVLTRHTHSYDHFSIVSTGAVNIEVNGKNNTLHSTCNGIY